jgi:phosphoglycerate-specific signal transduction histidine kinase
MPTLPQARKVEKGSPNPQDNELRQACLTFVGELAEPLTAIADYLEAASLLHDADTRSAHEKLAEVFEKSRIQVARADEILRRLRDLLRLKKGDTDT